MPATSNPTAVVTVNGITIPVKKATVTLAGAGTCGSANISTSLSQATKALGADPISLCRAAQAGVVVTINDTQVFQGLIAENRIALGEDEWDISCRDFTAYLQEGTDTVLVSANQTVSGLIVQMLQNIQSTIVAPGVHAYVPAPSTYNIGNPNDPIGAYFKNENSHLLKGKTYYQILSKVAQDNNFQMFFDRNGVFFFNDINGSGLLKTRTYIWGSGTGGGNLETLSIDQSAYKNSTFHVNTYSYTHKDDTLVVGTATGVGENYTGGGNKARFPGVYTGTTVAAAKAILGQGIPVYNFNIEALTNKNATKDAVARAVDVFVHELVITATIPGDETLDQYTYLQLTQTNISPLDGQEFRLVNITHVIDTDDFTTTIHAWKAPPTIFQRALS